MGSVERSDRAAFLVRGVFQATADTLGSFSPHIRKVVLASISILPLYSPNSNQKKAGKLNL